MRVLLVTVTLLTAPCAPAMAGVLVCEGNYYANGEPQPLVMTVSLDETTGEIRVSTSHGQARGTMTKSEEFYSGPVVAADSKSFHLSLNRYTGELMVIDAAVSRMDYTGTCQKKAPRF